MSYPTIENKHIAVGSNDYRLTIANEQSLRIPSQRVYVACLSDINSDFSISRTFFTIIELEKGLRAWIIKSDMLNDPESRVFQQIEQWDGVINI